MCWMAVTISQDYKRSLVYGQANDLSLSMPIDQWVGKTKSKCTSFNANPANIFV